MKRRRVSAAFVELDSAELIRTKDEEASLSEPRGLASSRNQNRRSPGATGEVNIMLGKTSSKKGQKRTGGGQHMSFNTALMDDSSHLADIAPKPRDMEHAMSTTSHTTETCGRTSLVTSNLVAKEDNRRPTAESNSISDVKLQAPLRVTRSGSATSNPQDDPSQTNHSVVVSATNLTSAPSQLEALDREPGSTRLSMQGCLIPFRPRRSTRKTHTLQTKADVDRSEADEDSVDRGEPSISSADSEHSNPPNQKGKRRRRVSRPHATSGTRRKFARNQARKYKNPGHAINQLSLTADPMGGFQLDPPEPNAVLHLTVIKSNPPDVNDGTDIPDITLPDIEKRQPSRTEVFTNKQTLVDISSCSPAAFDQTIPDADFKRPPDQHSLMWDAHGRGKTVGKKLTDALRGLKRTTHNHQALGNGARSTQMSGMTPTSPNSPGTTALQESSKRITRSQLSLGSKRGVEQVQSASSSACGEPAGPGPSRSTLDAEMISQRKDALLDTADPAHPHSPPARGSSNSKESTGHETGRDGAIECDKMPEDDPQMPRLSDTPANRADTPLANDRKEPDPQIFGGETAVSSQISVVLEDHHLEASFHPGDRGEQTPDSQRPLLAARSWASVSRSTRRGCAVDHNGSPRLKPQVVTSTGQIQSRLEMGRIRSMIRISDSSSIYSYSSDESLEEYLHEYLPEHLPEHQPVARPIWSKFQRDMFKEYGIEAEDLIKQKTKPFLFSGKAENDVYAKTLEESQKLEKRPVESPTHMNRATFGETTTRSVIQEKSLGGAAEWFTAKHR
ncbi:hypothetical protein N7481_004425 [Penicillium waksmanii]|uniref:uncharacterized protein n=1 Tax=Penicillium waksmanii TaxID=69791 RepID=UPI002547DAC3|nr:uncharacterized protein N7481_004425 [Penicillium waksmanii]KAJ5989215.1 hypothetical protein N7481_004425 [Penicillium waksmanii]